MEATRGKNCFEKKLFTTVGAGVLFILYFIEGFPKGRSQVTQKHLKYCQHNEEREVRGYYLHFLTSLGNIDAKM